MLNLDPDLNPDLNLGRQENQHARDRLHDQAKHLEHKERLVNMKEQELVELQNRVAQDKRQWQMSQKAQQTQLEEVGDTCRKRFNMKLK